MIHHEIQKMNLDEKRELMKSLAEDIETEQSLKSENHPYQNTDFDNPFNTSPPKHVKV